MLPKATGSAIIPLPLFEAEILVQQRKKKSALNIFIDG